MNEQDKKIVQIGVIFGLIVLLGVGYYYFTIVREEIRRQETQAIALKKDIAGLDKKLEEINQLEKFRKEVLEYQKVIEEASARLPNSPDDQGFLTNLVDILRKSKVVYRRINPEKPEGRSTYTEIPWSVKSRGTYFEFGPFLNMVELNPNRFMRIKTLKIDNDYEFPGYHPIDVKIATFMFNNATPSDTTAPAADAKPASKSASKSASKASKTAK